MLEPYAGKLARTVLRRRSGRKPGDLSGCLMYGFSGPTRRAEKGQLALRIKIEIFKRRS